MNHVQHLISKKQFALTWHQTGMFSISYQGNMYFEEIWNQILFDIRLTGYGSGGILGSRTEHDVCVQNCSRRHYGAAQTMVVIDITWKTFETSRNWNIVWSELKGTQLDKKGRCMCLFPGIRNPWFVTSLAWLHVFDQLVSSVGWSMIKTEFLWYHLGNTTYPISTRPHQCSFIK